MAKTLQLRPGNIKKPVMVATSIQIPESKPMALSDTKSNMHKDPLWKIKNEQTLKVEGFVGEMSSEEFRLFPQ